MAQVEGEHKPKFIVSAPVRPDLEGEEDEDGELEPQLRYERLGADVKQILKEAQATCLCLSEKILALGTSKGSIHVLDYCGNEVR